MAVDYAKLPVQNIKLFTGNDFLSVARDMKGKLTHMATNRPFGAWCRKNNNTMRSSADGSASAADLGKATTPFQFGDIVQAFSYKYDDFTIVTIDLAAIRTYVNGLTNIDKITRGKQEELYFIRLEAELRGITRTIAISATGAITFTDVATNNYVPHSLTTFHRSSEGQL